VGQEEKFCAGGHVMEWEVKYERKKQSLYRLGQGIRVPGC
jgi:hypothetical protein